MSDKSRASETHTARFHAPAALQGLSDESRRTLLGQVLSAATLLMMLTTWPLWLSDNVFPQVPLVAAFRSIPPWVDRLVAWAAILALGMTIWRVRHRSTTGWMSLAVLAFLFLFLGDQHRLQPWAYQFVLAIWVLAWGASASLRWLRWLMVSIYVYSAIGKFDVTFVYGPGKQMLQACAGIVGFEMSDAAAAWLAWGLPAAELSIGLLLLATRTRWLGVVLAIGMHLGLIVILGPLGLGHRPAVLIWNLSCLSQVALLFVTRKQAESEDAATHFSLRNIVWIGPVLAAILLPALESVGRWDSWLSWGLYSTRHARIELRVAQPAVAQLPDHLQDYFQSGDASAIWKRCDMARWSLATLRAPLYPHERFQLGVAIAVIECMPKSESYFEVIRYGAPDRWTGKASESRWRSSTQLGDAADNFYINAWPRPFEAD